MTMMRIRNLRVSFNAGTAMAVQALRGIDLNVEAGQFLTAEVERYAGLIKSRGIKPE